MKTSSIRIGTACMLAIGLTASFAVAQGGLTPPGAPSPSMKTLEQIEPRIDLATVAGDAGSHYIISEPGSYYLSERLAVSKETGIRVDVSDVTLDLNGFDVSRTSLSGGAGILLGHSAAVEQITVCNGSISGFDYGIRCAGAPYAEGVLLEDLSITDCDVYAIFAGSVARIADCRIFDNPGAGIRAGSGSSLSGITMSNVDGSFGIITGVGASLRECTISYSQPADTGIFAGSGATLEGCAVSYCEMSDYAIYAGNGSSLSGCTADGNDCERGIYVGRGSTLEGCTANNNNCVYGIYANYGASLRGCTASENKSKYGIYAYGHSSLAGCSAYGNEGNASYNYGIYAGFNSTVVDCTASFNSNTNTPVAAYRGVGIGIASGSILNCTASNNKGDGIEVGRDCVASGNSCNDNGYDGGDGAGIHADYNDNRIEGNNVVKNDRGLDVDGDGNLIIHNSASGNGVNYDIAASNVVGVVVNATLSGAVVGDSGGVGIGTSGSYVNITY